MLADGGYGGLVIALVVVALTALLGLLGFIVKKLFDISNDVAEVKVSVKSVVDEHCGNRLQTIETYLWPPGPPRARGREGAHR